MLDLTVLVPTRHEAGNVAKVAARVASALDPTGLTWQLVFVDDSDDETVQVAADLAARSPSIKLVHRLPGERVGGLSGAVLAGLAATSSRWVAVMDADLQHPPEVLARLVVPLVRGRADMAIGTRYAEGGSPGGLAGPWRTAVSASARGLARVLFPRARKVSDPLGGLFAFDRAVVTDVDLRPEGFKILLEVLVRGRWARAAEVPYAFMGRVDGRSKAGLREGMRFARHVGRLWLDAGQVGLSGPVQAAPRHAFPARRAA